MTNIVKTPHKHAALIKQWADGTQIQWYNNVANEWEETGKVASPCWDSTTQYRIKPEPKPDVVLYAMIAKEKDPIDSARIVSVRANQQLLNTDTCMFIFDGETGKLKDAQVLAHE